jgi:hypothetical protein
MGSSWSELRRPCRKGAFGSRVPSRYAAVEIRRRMPLATLNIAERASEATLWGVRRGGGGVVLGGEGGGAVGGGGDRRAATPRASHAPGVKMVRQATQSGEKVPSTTVRAGGREIRTGARADVRTHAHTRQSAREGTR